MSSDTQIRIQQTDHVKQSSHFWSNKSFLKHLVPTTQLPVYHLVIFLPDITRPLQR